MKVKVAGEWDEGTVMHCTYKNQWLLLLHIKQSMKESDKQG
jgi:hypothetical protein